jgi:phospholipid/cholesterol/gamma-HCH transport system substrate-binding protein
VESRDAMARVKELSGSLNETQKKVGDRLVSLAANLDSLASTMKGTAGKMDTFFTRVEEGEGSLGLLTSDDKLYREAQQTLTEMKRLLADIQKNPKKYVKLSIF